MLKECLAITHRDNNRLDYFNQGPLLGLNRPMPKLTWPASLLPYIGLHRVCASNNLVLLWYTVDAYFIIF